MDKKETIKQFLNLEFDSSGANSGLVLWYNKLLTKTVDELTEIDIARMIRQDIAVEFAIGKATQLIDEKEVLDELYEGELIEAIQKALERTGSTTQVGKSIKSDRISFYTDRIIWKLHSNKLSHPQLLLFDSYNANVKTFISNYTRIPPVILLWQDENLWTFVSGEEVVSHYSGHVARIPLDDINKTVHAVPLASKIKETKFNLNYMLLGDESIKVWAPEGAVFFALMNILGMFPLRH